MMSGKIDVMLKRIYGDKKSGASILAEELFDVLEKLAVESKSKKEFLRFIGNLKNDLKRYHPLLFQLQNLVEFVRLALMRGDKSEMLSTIKKVEERFKNASEKVAENFLIWLDENNFKKVSIATLSYSGTVLKCLSYAKDRISKVYVFRSCPRCEGDEMARKLVDEKFKVFLVNDFGADFVLNEVDLVVSGCDAIFKNGDVLNKAGTLTIFKIARMQGKDTIVLGDFSKFVNRKAIERKFFKQCFEIGKSGGVETVDVIFEIVSAKFIGYYITDAGILVNKYRSGNEIVYNLSEMFSLW